MAIIIETWTELWCPQARLEPHGSNRDATGQPLEGTKCMGEDCICWQMEEKATGKGWCRAWGPIAPFIQRKPLKGKDDE